MQKLIVHDTKLTGVKLIEPSTNFEDHRGEYVELYNRELFSEAGIDVDFKQDDISVSYKGVLRGIHGDGETHKLVSCIEGRFYIIVVNNDKDSNEYRKWQSFTLSDKNRLQLLMPPKFGNGHYILSDKAIFHYKQSTYYNRESQFTILWDDPAFGFFWPSTNPILSQRDAGLID